MRGLSKKSWAYMKQGNKPLIFTLSFLLLFSLGSYALAAALYHPSDNIIDPSCLPTDPNCYVDPLPDQTGNSGEYLTTDGTVVSWAAVAGSGITSLNGETGSTQSFSSSTSGTDFAISSSGNVHSFALPSASATNRGALTSADWTTFNNKLSAVIADGPLSGSGTSGSHLVIADAAADATTKGAATFIASDFDASSGVISIDYTNGQSAATSTKGFLTSTDWNTFNGKQAALGYTPLNPSNNLSDVLSTNTSLNTLLPNQATSAGKFLQTDGTNTAWATAIGGSAVVNQVSFGSGPNTITNSVNFTYDPTAWTFLVGFKDPVKNYLRVDATAKTYQLGDNSLGDGGTRLYIDDATKTSEMRGTSGTLGSTTYVPTGGSGTNDIVITGNYLGSASTTFTVTIDGNNRQVLDFSGLSGSFSIGEVVTGGSSGSTGTVVEASTSHVVLQMTGGLFVLETITGGTSGASATVTSAPAIGDTVSFIDGVGTNIHHNVRLDTTVSFSYGMGITSGTTSSHVIGNQWTANVTEAVSRGLALNFATQQYTLGSTSAAAYVNVNTTAGDVTIHGTGGSCTFTGASSGGTCFSDTRLKKNVENYSGALDSISKLRPVTYDWIDPSMPTGSNIGFIAQEVQEVFPEFVNPVGDSGYLGVAYSGFIVPVIAAVQELNLKVEPLLSIDPEVDGSLASLVLAFLKNAVVTIKEATIGTLRVSDKVCVDDVCVSKDQFKTLLMQAGGGTVSTPPPTPDPTPDPIIDPTPDPVPDPAPSTPDDSTETPSDEAPTEEIVAPPVDPTPPVDTPSEETPAE